MSALTSAEEKLRSVQQENETLVQQLIVLKELDVERMNFENERFVAKQQQQMQLELAEAVKEGKSVSPEKVKTIYSSIYRNMSRYRIRILKTIGI